MVLFKKRLFSICMTDSFSVLSKDTTGWSLVIVTFLDKTKALDQAQHSKLLLKFESHAIVDPVHVWLS